MEGKILVVNTGSTSTKIGLFDAGIKLFEKSIVHSPEALSRYKTVMDRREDTKDAIINNLLLRGVKLETIDLVMARGGLITPVVTGVYKVDGAMKKELEIGRNGKHACNLSAIVADDIVAEINNRKEKAGLPVTCAAYIADPPMADEMLPELKLSGRPEFTRRTLFHALNSRAVVRRYARSIDKSYKDLTVIVAHIGGGSSVSVHQNGRVIDTNDSLGGEGPITTERAGTVPAFQVIDLCFSGKYTKEEVQRLLVGKGGAIAYFGTGDFRKLIERAVAGNEEVITFLKAYCATVAKYIGYFSTVVCGKVDAIIITGGVAHNREVTDEIARRVEFIAPVTVYPGEDELDSLAENGYGILSGEFEVRTYMPDQL